jgi:hypothetical protein
LPSKEEVRDVRTETLRDTGAHTGFVGNYVYYLIADERVFALCEDLCGILAGQVESLHEVVAGGGR